MLASCSDKYSQRFYDTTINDSIDLLTPAEEAAFLETNFPVGVVPYLITVDSLDSSAPGVTADALFSHVSENHPEPEAFEKRGFLVVVSRHPSLIQTRAGSKINNFTRWKGIIAGPEYLDIQTTAYNDSLGYALASLSGYLEDRLPEIDSVSWWNRMQYNQAMSMISGEIEEFGYPSDSFYGNYLLKPVLRLRFWELRHLGTWWMTYFLVGLIIYLITRFLNFVVKYYTRRMGNKAVRSILLWLFTTGIGLILSLPALSSAVVLSSGRLEDMLALQGLGLKYVDIFSLSTDSFGVAAPWYLVGVLFILRLLKGMAGMSGYFTWTFVPDEYQRRSYHALKQDNAFYAAVVENLGRKGNYFEDTVSEEEFLEKPYSHAFYNTFSKEAQKAGLWAALALGFLSKAIVLAAIYLWLFPVLQGFVDYTKSIVKFNKTNPQYKVPLYLLFLFPVVLFGLVALFSLAREYSAYLLLGVLFLISSGVLLAVLTDYLTAFSSGWLLWTLALSLPVYYAVRIVMAAFQTDLKLRRMFIQYVIVTAVSFGVLLYLYVGQQQFNVRETVVELFPSTAGLFTQKHAEEARRGTITAEAVNLREGPSADYPVVAQVMKTDTFLILKEENGWWQIRLREADGYIHADYAKEVRNFLD